MLRKATPHFVEIIKFFKNSYFFYEKTQVAHHNIYSIHETVKHFFTLSEPEENSQSQRGKKVNRCDPKNDPDV